MANILWIASERAEGYPLITQVQKKEFTINLAANGKDALAYLSTFTCDIIVVDAISLRTSGTRICLSLQKVAPKTPILLITESAQPDDVAAEVLIPPFTSRKLINRVKKLMPAEKHDIRQLGELRLDTTRHLVSCNGAGKKKLTPKQSSLLQMFMDRPVRSSRARSCSAWSGKRIMSAICARSTCTSAACARRLKRTCARPKYWSASAVLATAWIFPNCNSVEIRSDELRQPAQLE